MTGYEDISFTDYEDIIVPSPWEAFNRATNSVATRRHIVGYIKKLEEHRGSASGWSVRTRDTGEWFDIGQKLPDGTYVIEKRPQDGLLPYLYMEQPTSGGAVADDAPRLKLMMEQAIASGKTLVIPDRVWNLNSPQTVTVPSNLRVRFEGNAQLRITQPFVLTAAKQGATRMLTADAARLASTITVNDASGIQVGDVVYVYANTTVETGWSTKKHYTSTVSAVTGNVITLAHPLHFAYTVAEGSTAAFYRGGQVGIEGLNVFAARNTTNLDFQFIKGVTHTGVNLDADPWDVTLDTGPQHVRLTGVVDFQASQVRIKNGCYGYLPNYTRNTRWRDVQADACRHPVAPAAWAADVWVDGLETRDCFSALDSHPAFNVNYSNVKSVRDRNPGNIRSLGGSLRNAQLHNIASSTAGSLFHSLALSDLSLYNEFDFEFENVEWEGNGGIGAWRGRTVTMRNVRAPWVHASAQSGNQIGKLVLDNVVATAWTLNVANVERREGATGLLSAPTGGGVTTIDLSAAGVKDGQMWASARLLNQMAGEPATVTVRILDNVVRSSPGVARALLKIKLRAYVRHSNAGAWDYLERDYLILHQIAAASRVDPAVQLWQSPATGQANASLALTLGNLTQNGITQTGSALDQYGNHYVQFDVSLSSGRTSPFYSLTCDVELMSV